MIDTPAIEKLLGELEALHEKATPGPWQHHGSHFYGPDTDRFLIGHVLSNDGRLVPDRNLIVAAVNAIPTLITTIRALMEAVEEGRRAARNRDMWKAQCERQADALAAIRSKGDACPSNRPEDS